MMCHNMEWSWPVQSPWISVTAQGYVSASLLFHLWNHESSLINIDVIIAHLNAGMVSTLPIPGPRNSCARRGATLCTKCSPGYDAPVEEATHCSVCNAGKYSLLAAIYGWKVYHIEWWWQSLKRLVFLSHEERCPWKQDETSTESWHSEVGAPEKQSGFPLKINEHDQSISGLQGLQFVTHSRQIRPSSHDTPGPQDRSGVSKSD